MINYKPQIVNILKQASDNVVESWSEDWESLPVIIYEEEANQPYQFETQGESLTLFRYRIDIYSKESTSALKLKINDLMATQGLLRVSSVDTNEEGMRHSQMRFEGVYDSKNEKIYRNRI